MSILLFLSVFFVAVCSIPSSNQQLSYIHSGGGNPSGYATSTYVNSSSDSTGLNLLGLGVFEVMLADLAGLQSAGPVPYSGSWYSTDDGIINLSIIYKLNLVQNYSKIYLDMAPILSYFVNESVEFQFVLKACVVTHNKAAKLVELYKCGHYNITDHSGCANFTELGGTEAIYQSAVWNFSKLTAVRFWQASVEIVGRSFLDDNDQKADPVGHPVQNMDEVFSNRGTPPKYTASPAAPTQLDATVLDYSLSMRPNVSSAVLDALFAPLHVNSSVCATRFPALTTGMSAEANRWWNMMHLYVQPWHSKIRPEYAALAAAQDAKASALNISTYGQLLSALGLSSTGHANPNANPLLGGLLDVNAANYLANATTLNGDQPVPKMPKAIFAATFHRAHDSILAQSDGLFSDYYTGNAAIDLLVDDMGTPLYHCYPDPALGGGVCNNQSIFSFVVLSGQTYFLPLSYSNVASYPYTIKVGDNTLLSHSVGAIWAFNMYDQGYIGWNPSLHTMFNEPYQGTRFADLGVTACVPELVYSGLRWYYPTSCGACSLIAPALPY